MGSDALGAVLEVRVVLSLAGLSVTASALVAQEGSKSPTVAVVAAVMIVILPPETVILPCIKDTDSLRGPFHEKNLFPLFF